MPWTRPLTYHFGAKPALAVLAPWMYRPTVKYRPDYPTACPSGNNGLQLGSVSVDGLGHPSMARIIYEVLCRNYLAFALILPFLNFPPRICAI